MRLSTAEERKVLREQIIACLKERGELEYPDLEDDLAKLYRKADVWFSYGDVWNQLDYLVMTKQVKRRGSIYGDEDVFFSLRTERKPRKPEPTPLLDMAEEQNAT